LVRHMEQGIEYSGKNLDFISFPLGGIGAGMVCLDGNGGFSNASLRHKPELNKPVLMFATLTAEKKIPRVLTGPVADWKIYGLPGAGNGLGATNFGLPVCKLIKFVSKFPFGTVYLKQPDLPLNISICGWSPFIPADPDNSSLPVAAIEYEFKNYSGKEITGTFSFHCKNIVATNPANGKTRVLNDGYILYQEPIPDQPHLEGYFAICIPDEESAVNCWSGKGGFSDTHQLLWKDICHTEKLNILETGPGASTFVNITINPKSSKKITVLISWFVPNSQMKTGEGDSEYYQPWYTSRFQNINEIYNYWKQNYTKLKKTTEKFAEAFFTSDIPFEVIDAISSNLSIFKSPTMLRQKDGRLWCWEGCCDCSGCCAGSCTHVWNYCQAIAHLFPSLERSLRETEFNENQNEKGHQNFRSLLPIRQNTHNFHAAADGQLGGIMKVYRDWKISGNDEWLKNLWPKIKQSLDYCIETWDPSHKGVLEKPHHNTYDIEFWGPDGMCTSIYLGALKAAIFMAKTLGHDYSLYENLYRKGKKFMEEILFNGEYFEQKIVWEEDELKKYREQHHLDETMAQILEKEGPFYQYGKGCFSDGIMGAWLAEVCFVGEILDRRKVKKHLSSVWKYNFKKNLSEHVNFQRPGFALGSEGGLLVCSWPRGDRPTIPCLYCDEVWTGIEYQVASCMIINGMEKQGLKIVETARKRYDGTKRNPFDEYECGHWYGRALSSFALLYAITGIRYDAVEKILYMKRWKKDDCKAFFCTDSGWGIAGFKKGKPFVKVMMGRIEVKKITVV